VITKPDTKTNRESKDYHKKLNDAVNLLAIKILEKFLKKVKESK